MPDPLLTPRSVVVVGASRNRSKLGAVIARNLVEGRFRGRLGFVNPAGGRLLGRPVYPSVAELPRGFDLAVIAVPAPAVTAVVRDLGQCGVRAAIVIASGFAESGALGIRREAELMNAAAAAHVRLLGPNCLGVVNPWVRLNASFGGPLPKPGAIAVVSQSGAMAVAVADWARSRNLGISAMVSLGNEADRDAAWALGAVAADRRTRAVLLYLENLRNPRAFIATARRIVPRVRTFAVLAGQSSAGASAAASHTGRIATSTRLTAAALQDAGVVVVDGLAALFRAGELTESYPDRDPARVAIVTNAGGAGVLAADALERSTLQLASFRPATARRLRPLLPGELSVHNPLDLRGDAPPARFGRAVAVLGSDPGVDAVLVLGTPQVVTHPSAAADAVVRAAHRTRSMVLASFLGGEQVAGARERLTAGGVLNAAYPEHALAALDALHRSFTLRRSVPRTLTPVPRPAARIRGPVLVGPYAERVLRRYGIPVARSRFVPATTRGTPRVRFPVVAKVVHPRILHKVDVGGVRTHLASRAELLRAVGELRRLLPDRTGGVQLQEQRRGFEVYVGGLRHPRLGPVLAFGSGGTAVERNPDTEFVVLPAPAPYLRARLAAHPITALLKGFRGERGNIPQLLRVLVRTARLLERHPEIMGLDLNPVMVDERSAVAVDARILVATYR